MRLVEDAQKSQSRAQTLAQRAAFYLTVIAIGAGVLTLHRLAAHHGADSRRRAQHRDGAGDRLPARAGVG
jgi:cation transport ATPase